MEGPSNAASPTPSEASPAVPSQTSQPPQVPQIPQIIVNVGGGRFSRVLSWIGWSGFLSCALLLLVRSLMSSDYLGTSSEVDEKYHSGAKAGRDKVAIISVSGTILDGSFVKQQIDRANQDKDVKAVVLRVVSPGGTITGSDYILHHLKKLQKER